MFNTVAYTVIDTVQTGKKQFVEAFVKHEGLANILNSFVDSQTAYTKSAVDAGISTATSLTALVSNKQFYDQMTESMKSFVPASFVPSFATAKKSSKKA